MRENLGLRSPGGHCRVPSAWLSGHGAGLNGPFLLDNKHHGFSPKQLQVLTFWHLKILKARFVYPLPTPVLQSAISLRSSASFDLEIVVETKTGG